MKCRWTHKGFRIRGRQTAHIGLCLGFMSVLSASALAQVQSKTTASEIVPRDGLSLNLTQPQTFVGLSPTLRRAVTDLPSDDTSLFNFTDSDAGCFSSDAFCLTDKKDLNRLDVGYSKQNFLSLNSSGLDLELTPSASVHFDDESQSAVVGAILRIGDDLREGANFDKNTWYFLLSETRKRALDIVSGMLICLLPIFVVKFQGLIIMMFRTIFPSQKTRPPCLLRGDVSAFLPCVT